MKKIYSFVDFTVDLIDYEAIFITIIYKILLFPTSVGHPYLIYSYENSPI